MSNVAQRVAIEAIQPRAFTSTPVESPAALLLNPDGSSTPKAKVYLYTFTSSGKAVSGYALSEDSQTFYTGGLAWQYKPGSPYAFFVTFVFTPSTPVYATEIMSDKLSYSDTYTGTQGESEQALCIPVPTDGGIFIYSYRVHFSDGTTHDPEIVVTPIPS